MPFGALEDPAFRVLGEAAGAEGDAVVEFHGVADAAGLADDDAGAVIDEKVRADPGPGVDVDPGAAVGPFGHHAGDEGDALAEEDMGGALDGDGLDGRVGNDDDLDAGGGRIALVGGLDIGAEEAPDFGQAGQEVADQFLRGLLVAAAALFGEAEAFGDLGDEAVHEFEDPSFGEGLDLFGGDGFLIVEPREEEAEEVLAHGRDGALGGEIGAIDPVDPSDLVIGIDESPGDSLFRTIFHAKENPRAGLGHTTGFPAVAKVETRWGRRFRERAGS